MAKKMSDKPDPEMLENLELLLNMEVLEEEESWSVIEEVNDDGEQLFEKMDGQTEDNDES